MVDLEVMSMTRASNYEEFDQIKIGQRIKEIRKEYHLSVEEFAEEVGVSNNAVYKWQRGDSAPDIYNLWYISTHFDVSLDYLIVGRKEAQNVYSLQMVA